MREVAEAGATVTWGCKDRGARRSSPIIIGEVVANTDSGAIFVRYRHGDAESVRDALSLPSREALRPGHTVAIAFLEDDPSRPLVLGILNSGQGASADGQTLRLAARRVEIEAGDELVLRCGQASIVLSRLGRLLTRAVQIVTRARGAHRVQGASVHIN